MTEQPLVSVCVPVRNGGTLLEHALHSILCQTYENFEVLISDNCSTDNTRSICLSYLQTDKRAQYVRQESPLTAMENFSFLLGHAQGKYILFCAHDDLRNREYIEALVSTMEMDARAVVAFGNVFWFSDKFENAQKEEFDFSTVGMGVYRRLIKTAFRRSYHIYGLWRADELRKLSVRRALYGPDMQMMLAACCLGTFAKNDVASFYYRETTKTYEDRAKYEFNEAKVSRLYVLEGIWASFLSVRQVGGLAPAMVGCASFVARELWVRMWVRSGLRIQRLITTVSQILSGNAAARS